MLFTAFESFGLLQLKKVIVVLCGFISAQLGWYAIKQRTHNKVLNFSAAMWPVA